MSELQLVVNADLKDTLDRIHSQDILIMTGDLMQGLGFEAC